MGFSIAILSRATYMLSALVLIALAAFSVSLGVREARLALLAPLADHESFEVLRAGVPRRALSLHGNRILLYACDDILRGRLGPLLPASVLTDIVDGCLAQSEKIHAAAPTWSFPQYLRAVAAYHEGDFEEAVDLLAASQALGPYESWLAERRVELALDLDLDTSTFTRTLEADLRSLLESPLGRSFVASLYVRSPAQRESITGFVESLNDEKRRDFLRRLRQEWERQSA